MSLFSIILMCQRRDLNPHELPRTILSRVRLPIPPLWHISPSNPNIFPVYQKTSKKQCDIISPMNTPNSQFFGDSIFWIDLDKIKANPFQPRREFDEAKLRDLSESIRMYGILQPIVVTRKEVQKEDGGLAVEYELISGERRTRASRLAGLQQIPALIRSGEEDSRVKLELAIIENLQREDLNPVDRARSFARLADEFGLKHNQIAEKVGKSREYVTNTMRILALPEEILNGLGEGRISEGHTRPLLMLADRPEEQLTLYKEIVYKKLTVREAEAIARKVAVDRVRKKERMFDPTLVEMEKQFKETLGTRVHIEQTEKGGKLTIDFFSTDDLQSILALVKSKQNDVPVDMLESHIQKVANGEVKEENKEESVSVEQAIDDRNKEEKKSDEEELYSIKNFVV